MSSFKILQEYIKELIKKESLLKEGKDYVIIPYPDELNVDAHKYGFKVHSIEIQKNSLDMLHGFEKFSVKFFLEIGNTAKGYSSQYSTKQVVPLDDWTIFWDKDENIIVNIEKEDTHFGLVSRRTLSQNEIDVLKHIILGMMKEN